MDKYNWKEYNLTPDGQFACRYCKGTKQQGLPIGSNNMVKCWMCNGSGYMIDVILKDLEFEHAHHNQTRKELEDLKQWIKATSKCSKCYGNSHKTPGGCACPECSLVGEAPWGG